MTPFNCTIWIIFSYAISIIVTWLQVTWESGYQDNSIDSIHISRIQNRQMKWRQYKYIACYNNDDRRSLESQVIKIIWLIAYIYRGFKIQMKWRQYKYRMLQQWQSQVTWESGDQDNSIDTIHIPRIQNRQMKGSINTIIACYNNDQIALQTIKESQTLIYCTILNFTRCLPSCAVCTHVI